MALKYDYAVPYLEKSRSSCPKILWFDLESKPQCELYVAMLFDVVDVRKQPALRHFNRIGCVIGNIVRPSR